MGGGVLRWLAGALAAVGLGVIVVVSRGGDDLAKHVDEIARAYSVSGDEARAAVSTLAARNGDSAEDVARLWAQSTPASVPPVVLQPPDGSRSLTVELERAAAGAACELATETLDRAATTGVVREPTDTEIDQAVVGQAASLGLALIGLDPVVFEVSQLFDQVGNADFAEARVTLLQTIYC